MGKSILGMGSGDTSSLVVAPVFARDLSAGSLPLSVMCRCNWNTLFEVVVDKPPAVEAGIGGHVAPMGGLPKANSVVG